MDQKLQISSCLVCDRLLPLVARFPWLQVAQSEEVGGDQILYNKNDRLSYYPCRIPVLTGRRIRGCFHGWVILSTHPENVMWLLWNPVTNKAIHLPPMVLENGHSESITDCCLPSPPDDIGSVLLLNRPEHCSFVFCRLDRKRKRLRWTEMAYDRQLKSMSGQDGFLRSLTCCNGKVYALHSSVLYSNLIQVEIVVKNEEVVITLLPFVNAPNMFFNGYFTMEPILKGCKELFYINVGVSETMRTFTDVWLFRLDMTSMIWEKLEDLNDAIYFVDLAHHCWFFYRPTISSEVGGYIHIFSQTDKVISSYNIIDNTVSLSSMPCLVSSNNVPLWECRAEEEGTKDEIVTGDYELVDVSSTKNSPLVNIPIDVLKMIMELCLGVEYLNFRATCKRCQLAAPLIRWSNEASISRLQTYSLASPWLVVFDRHRGIITFTDPMFGDKYFKKTPQEFIGDVRIRYSRHGWLLVCNLSHEPLSVMLFNPFTNDIRELPHPLMGNITNVCFSDPPTSQDFLVVGFIPEEKTYIYISKINTECWQRVLGFFPVDTGEIVPRSISFPTPCDRRVVYALEAGGRLDLYRWHDRDRFWEVIAEAPQDCSSAAQCFLVKCDKHCFILVRMDEYGELVEVFKLNQTTQEWEKLECLGRHMIYICGATCLCMEAKTPEMENKIYFPRLHSKNGKIIFYSLETRRFHTFNGRKVEEESFRDFLGTKYILNPHAWIEPSWC
ncbi:hypothetical protein SSX86_012648 [Deinandra increscens subsp. villosa]|uniref:KIB1-4 beta-propeller domain-containing protein n=1 Tax=Deinandra increscens subsp. villosa TaxID=3103831 RepID=A0AAP0GYZ6_9ASTR